jgi:hypothetical protein
LVSCNIDVVDDNVDDSTPTMVAGMPLATAEEVARAEENGRQRLATDYVELGHVQVPRAMVPSANEPTRATEESSSTPTGVFAATLQPVRTWPFKTIPVQFVFSGEPIVSANIDAVVNNFMHACRLWEVETARYGTGTGIRCIPYTAGIGLSDSLVVRVSQYNRCGSYIGSIGGPQLMELSLQCALQQDYTLHEIGHAIGLIHEHQRWDRDTYVEVLWNNILSSAQGDFVKLLSSRTLGYYDFRSIMHYYPLLASTGATETMRPRGDWNEPPFFLPFDQMGGFFMTVEDARRAAELYQRPTPPTSIPGAMIFSNIANGHVAGWTAWPDNPTVSVSIQLYVENNVSLGQIPANLPNSAANAAGFPGSHGFQFSLPDSVRDGRPHTLYAYVGLSDGSRLPLGSPLPFTLGMSCSVSVSPNRGNLETRHTITTSTANAQACTWRVDNRPAASIACNGTAAFTASQYGAGAHTGSFVAAGSAGSKTCTTTWNTGTYVFADVPPEHFAQRSVDAAFRAGIVAGCATAPARYCPDVALNRAEMAVILLKARHGSGFVPPPATGIFPDVPAGHWAAQWIEELARSGITSGCGGGNYCPSAPITRAQMAVFLLRARYSSWYKVPAPTGMFVDVPTTYWAAAWIEQLARLGFTQGCAPGYYCPEQAVTRAQAAVFVAYVFAIPM